MSIICSAISIAQQVFIDNSLPLEQLIQESLGQNCVEITNISSTVNGSINGFSSYGYFEKADSNFPFENGVVLTTGNANSAGNVQNSNILNEGDTSWGTDSDLETILGVTGTLNATSIAFNFVSISNQIEFNYIFASEEYFSNFPCDNSDSFVFLIREAGSADPFSNIALVPDTLVPVSANTIHDEIFGFCEASNEQYFEGYNVGDTNYNGRTTVLSTTVTIQPNVPYEIKLVIADQTDKNYDSAVFIELNSFNASVDLGNDFSTCASNALLDGNIENPNAIYTWFFNNAAIPSANSSTYSAVQAGNYRVEIEVPFTTNTCIIEDDINIDLSSTQSSDPIEDFNLCDDSTNDGIEIFDLSEKNAEIIASVPASDYIFSYHYNNADAVSNTNTIIGPIENTSNPQTIYVRIQDSNSGCLAYSTITLNVNKPPTIIVPTPLVLCDDQTSDGSIAIDLNALKNNEITAGQTDLVVTYHSTAFNAANVINALSMPYTNTNANEQLFVSVTDPATGCNSTTTLDITVLNTPDINRVDLYIDACAGDSDFANFDLTSIIPEVIQGLTNVSISFYRSQNDALAGTSAIANETSYQNITASQQTIFIRVEDNTTGCPSISRIEIHTNFLLTETVIEDITVCDRNNDGTEEFDFSSIATNIINGLPNINVVFYETETDRTDETNPIDPDILYNSQSSPQTIYLALESLSCNAEAEIELLLAPIINFDSVVTLETCDDDLDGLMTIDLSSFDAAVTDGLEGFSVIYFLTEAHANANTNVLPNFYTNTTNPFILFPRISFDETGCSDINSFQVQVLLAPETEKPEDIIICDADRDGFSTLNLNNSIPNSIRITPNRAVTFHNSQFDANSDTNGIPNASSYDAQTEIVYLRVENTIAGCYAVEELNIIVNTLPYVGDLTNYINELTFCEEETDGIGEFIFEIKDLEVLDGQTGKEVSYYLNQTNADNKTSPIDKTIIYENISNPQDIYIRVDNSTDESCYTTTSFFIEVGTNPEYNTPANILVCDDGSNDGSEVFNLSTKITEVSAGILDIENVTFYTSQQDARDSTNAIPLQFANTVNPQEIFIQIDNGTICNSITSFVVNVIQVPDVSPVEPIIKCVNNGDVNSAFDLTVAELNIIDVRQDDISINYYQNLEDSESNTNAILDPENFTNTSNPQTVYFKITNTVSNCYATFPINLIVNEPPAINDFITYNICANANGTADLTDINQVVTDVNFNVLFNYFSNEADAMENRNALDTNYSYITNNDTLFVRAEFSTTRCSEYYAFTLNVNPLPIANQPSNLMACDTDFDGLLEFDLLQQNSSILGSQNPSLFSITYHTNLLEANENNSALDTDYMALNGELIYARVQNTTTGCYRITEFSTFVNPLPIIDIENQVICLDDLPLLISANTNNPTDQYLWSTGEITPEIELVTIGTYSVTVTSAFGCENTRVFEVLESEAATIEFTEVVDFSDPNNITVTVSGIGNYLYQLDDFEPQESNVFVNVAMGYHTIRIIDLNGCADITKDVLVIDVPKFFTPNNDGDFDTWHIVGVETLPGTIIYIFDRYGKLLKTLSSNTPGWDGTLNNTQLPTSDYWFVADVKRGDRSFEVKGHFSLKR
jgi:gliding motility-associated-like protein